MDQPARLMGDKAYDSDSLDEALAQQGIQMIAPHRENRKKPPTQDGRPLRRYRSRWKVERLFAWLQNPRLAALDELCAKLWNSGWDAPGAFDPDRCLANAAGVATATGTWPRWSA